jgi:hypothetical protein
VEIVAHIIVCGDSFCSADTTDERFHFSQILEDVYNHKINRFSQAGCGNLAICFQIKQAIECKPDVIIFNSTWPGRIDVPLKKYNKESGLNHCYKNPKEQSTTDDLLQKHTGYDALFSTSVAEDFEHDYLELPEAKAQALKQYFSNLFDYNYWEEVESWCIEFWASIIEKQSILPVSLRTHSEIGKHLYEFSAKDLTYPKLYHTDRATQILVADKIQNLITKTLGVS